MDFHDENFIQILRSNTKTRDGVLPFEIILDDDKNYHNDEFLLFMGDHSKIKKIINNDGKAEFALKIIKINKIQKGQLEYFDVINNEIKFLKRLNHPNIIGFKDFFKDNKYFYIVYELAEYGNLLSYYRKTKTFTEDDVFRMFFQILLAVDYLHKSKIIHRNLKLESVLIDIHNNFKLSNFKYSCEIYNITQLSKDFLEDNLNYCPPEVILHHPYDYKFDIWSLGIILYELLSKTCPFNGIIIEHTIHNILNSNTLIKGILSEPLKNLLSRLLSKDSTERPTTEEILKHEWILQNIQRNDVSFLNHPAFMNCNNLQEIIKYSNNFSFSNQKKKIIDIKKITFFNKVTTQHQSFLKKQSEDESKKFPNIFHDGHFERSFGQKTLNKSFDFNKNHNNLNNSISPNKQKKIFEAMREPVKPPRIEEDEYEVIQHVKERNSMGTQEEQRFSYPVVIERKKKNENRRSDFGENNNKINKSSHSLNSREKIIENSRENIIDNSQRYIEPKSRFYNKKEESKYYNKKDESGYQEKSQMYQNDMSERYSSKSNNKNLYFENDFSDKNLYM